MPWWLLTDELKESCFLSATALLCTAFTGLSLATLCTVEFLSQAVGFLAPLF